MVNVVPALTSVKTVKVQSVTLETKTCKYFAHTLPGTYMHMHMCMHMHMHMPMCMYSTAIFNKIEPKPCPNVYF